jgi:photosystem II stability/assembly factor-like uncharacterized protein
LNKWQITVSQWIPVGLGSLYYNALFNGEEIMKRLATWTIIMALVFSIPACSNDDNDSLIPPRTIGWAIGHRSDGTVDGTAAILHTSDGGKTWEEQGNPSFWEGMTGNDISAVDEWTAWAAVGGDDGGAILHTSDGGLIWTLQPLPAGMTDVVKGIKGLSQKIAWAVTLTGIVMQTLDGGETWVIIPHEGITMKQVNRMDAKGEDIWIADYGSGERGMIHSPDFGQTWRQETLINPDPLISTFGPMAVSIVSSQVVWAATRPAANVYRTMDGGDPWHLDAPDISGPNDLDDICAPNANMVWAVQNHSGESGGVIISVQLEDGKVISNIMDPTHEYQYEGVTCFDEKTAWVVGFKAHGVSPDVPEGVILHTGDGGTNWTNQPIPVNDVALWKVSFVGAHR